MGVTFSQSGHRQRLSASDPVGGRGDCAGSDGVLDKSSSRRQWWEAGFDVGQCVRWLLVVLLPMMYVRAAGRASTAVAAKVRSVLTAGRLTGRLCTL